MNSLKLNDVCVICLEHSEMINWNEEMFEFCGMTYKDCYYKYTELSEENSLDEFPTNVCEECADGLKNSYLIFKKALESYQILEIGLKSKDVQDAKFFLSEPEETQMKIHESSDIFNEISKVDSATDDKYLIREEIFLTNISDHNISVTEADNATNSSNELEKSEDDAIQPGHFIDIQNYESDESLLTQEIGESFDAKEQKNDVTKRMKFDSSSEEKDGDGVDIKLTRSKAARKTRKRKCESALSEILMEEEYDDSCGNNTSLLPITNKAEKKKKKYLFMCAYCSLQVNGRGKLKIHESTHTGDRERTQTCPKCGIKLFTEESLRSHIQIHDENRIKKHKCEFCEKAFFNRGALNVHRRIHLGLMVKCQICSKEYCRQIDLDRHLLAHSATAADKKFEEKKYTVQCQYCNKHVPSTCWRGHKAAHLNEPQAKCRICDKDFFSRQSCVRHIQRVHGKKKGYKDFIYNYVDWSKRMSHLIMTQTEVIKIKS